MTHKRQTDNETDSTENLKVRHTRTFIDRQTDTQTDRQTHRQTHRQTDTQTDTHTYIHTYTHVHTHITAVNNLDEIESFIQFIDLSNVEFPFSTI